MMTIHPEYGIACQMAILDIGARKMQGVSTGTIRGDGGRIMLPQLYPTVNPACGGKVVDKKTDLRPIARV